MTSGGIHISPSSSLDDLRPLTQKVTAEKSSPVPPLFSCCRDEWVAFTVLHDEMSDRYSKGKDLDPCLASSASKRSVVARPYLRLLLSGQQMSLFLKISSTKVYVSCSLCLNLFFDSHMSGSLVVPLLALDDSQNAPSNRQITHHMCRLLCL